MKCSLGKALVYGSALLSIGLFAAPAAAQYKWQSPDGVTVYGDVPPPGGAQRLDDRTPSATSPSADDASNVESTAALPFTLNRVASKLPVVLYTAPECSPCQSARAHLQARGIPFSEKSISTTADFEAFKSQGFNDNGFPAMTVGREKTVGFEAGTWSRILDSAGYPKTSQLPFGYKQAGAEPLTPPVAQRTNVTVQAATASKEANPSEATASARAGSGPQRAIDRYRASLEAAQRAYATRGKEEDPSLRF